MNPPAGEPMRDLQSSLHLGAGLFERFDGDYHGKRLVKRCGHDEPQPLLCRELRARTSRGGLGRVPNPPQGLAFAGQQHASRRLTSGYLQAPLWHQFEQQSSTVKHESPLLSPTQKRARSGPALCQPTYRSASLDDTSHCSTPRPSHKDRRAAGRNSDRMYPWLRCTPRSVHMDRRLSCSRP